MSTLTGPEIQAARQALGLSQSQAASLWGVNVETLRQIERERSRPETTLGLLSTVIAYHRAYGPPPAP
ncbi:helix-turn-helix domain-containing protein [Niveispirillum sp.]|uniref:helix-turn-helix domain-containing protein n=1 Tax=Niveispirillum sp. TaxID=1917217 RepID=UPI001B5BEB29|nr:helix-turn-helix domain-containing protein [Niveispirillum sp.]MBP7338828.1 helix-turn-helix domain-containing protein [Niveispirillum sp.]